MVGIQSSCNPPRLAHVIEMCYKTLAALFYNFTREDKEEIVLEVMLKFETDQGKYSDTTYGKNYCINKATDFIRKNKSKKRCAQTVIDGRREYLHDVSLDDINDIPVEDGAYIKSEWVMQVEQVEPKLSPILDKVLQGDKLTYRQKSQLKKIIKNS